MELKDSLSIKEDVLKVLKEYLVPLNLTLHTHCDISEQEVSTDTGVGKDVVQRFRTGIEDMRLKNYCTLSIYYLQRSNCHFSIIGFVDTLEKALANHECIVCEIVSPEELAKHPEYTVLLEYKGKKKRGK